MAETAQGSVHLTVNLRYVDTQTDHVVVLQDGPVIIVPQVNFCQRIFNIFKKILVEGSRQRKTTVTTA